MKIDIPYFCVAIECAGELADVATRISAVLCPGITWQNDSSGYTEEVPALITQQLVLGLRFFLIEQKAGRSFTLQSHFIGYGELARNADWVECDISKTIACLLNTEAGFSAEKLENRGPEKGSTFVV